MTVQPTENSSQSAPRHVDYVVYAAARKKSSGKYNVTFPDFPKASVIDAPTLDDAKKFAKECVGGFINDIVKKKEVLPMPITENAFRKRFKFSSGYFRLYINVRLIEEVKS